MTHVKYASDGPRFQTLMILRCSFKLHDTTLQLHEWTRSEKMKLKEKEAQAQGDARGEEKALSAEGEVNETFEGEMDNFQTPLVRRGPLHRSLLRNILTFHRVSVLIQLSSLVPLVRLHSSILFSADVDGSSCCLIGYARRPSGLS